ncbi:SWIM zinc finger family protein [Desertimonas flava]|uniref:SWIM zinc finger family protein n=1 Tax=Desertimonas flava TaxID=2064846 RepID=UPI000E34B2DC|nr:SWIM zinc finger family protein [Desertimonas flava]
MTTGRRPASTPAPTLRALLDMRTVKALAGTRTFDRGSAYGRDGRVSVSHDSVECVEAQVRGSSRYGVAVWVDDGELYWRCTCPAADDGAFCKHAVAVSVGVIDGRWADENPPADGRPAKLDLGTYVAALPHERLVEIVMAAVADDLALQARLTTEMVLASGEPMDVRDWKRRFDRAIDNTDRKGFVDYHHAHAWAAGVGDVVDATRNLLGKDERSGRDVADVVEHAVGRLVDATQFVDDDGDIAGLLSVLTALHFDACAVARFDPIDLAHRLVDLESRYPDFAPFFGAAQTHGPLLGPQGVAEMQRLTRAAWESMAPPEGGISSEWDHVHRRMIATARTSGDADEVIAVHSRDLSKARAYPDIIVALRAAGRNDEAIDWAERALAEPGRWTPRSEIREHLAALLIERGDDDRARELFWDVFAADQTVEAYRRWLEAAGPDRQAAADRALEWLRPVAEAAATAPTGNVLLANLGSSPKPVHTLIEALLTDGRIDEAWETARRLEYVGPLIPKLAEAREATHPLDAVGVYESMVIRQIHLKNNEAYADAVELMGRIRHLCERAGASDRFHALLSQVRTDHKIKRNLMKLLASQDWD